MQARCEGCPIVTEKLDFISETENRELTFLERRMASLDDSIEEDPENIYHADLIRGLNDYLLKDIERVREDLVRLKAECAGPSKRLLSDRLKCNSTSDARAQFPSTDLGPRISERWEGLKSTIRTAIGR